MFIPEGLPRASTKITAFAFGEIFFSNSSGFILKSSRETSTKIGLAPKSSITFTVAGYEKSETRTSSPSLIFNIFKHVHKAVVAEEVGKQYFALVNLEISELNSFIFVPFEYIPELIIFSNLGDISSNVNDGFTIFILDIIYFLP